MPIPVKQVKQTIRDPKTGRFQSVLVDAHCVETSLNPSEEMKTNKSEKKVKATRAAAIEPEDIDLDDCAEDGFDESETDTHRIKRLSCGLIYTAIDFENAFYAMGVIPSTPLDLRFSDHDEDCMEDSDARIACNFEKYLEQVCDYIRTNNGGTKPRPFTVVGERGVTSLAAMAYVLNRAADTLIGQDPDREAVYADLMSRDLAGHAGYYMAETWINDMNQHVRSTMDSLSVMLFGQATESNSEIPEEVTTVTGSTFSQHISGVGDMLDTTLEHAKAFKRVLKQML